MLAFNIPVLGGPPIIACLCVLNILDIPDKPAAQERLGRRLSQH